MKCLLCDNPVPIVKGVLQGNLCQAHHDVLNNQTIPPHLEVIFQADKADREPFRQHIIELSRTARKDKMVVPD